MNIFVILLFIHLSNESPKKPKQKRHERVKLNQILFSFLQCIIIRSVKTRRVELTKKERATQMGVSHINVQSWERN